ncbi:response regulator [Hyphomicrobium facile]|uniref:DNA-binding response regulator, NarL/FixJ family, contains REC and HTH domains n=1 Tax=Hyphomicrobium facile TaxID=51670 RepID=A0A1I7NDJ8_9HYPH|nr:response regulator transcription factor [Hyphomicrobium facile]SFV32633.1 DNA-binding response regulator, NarL/FixJ family, contains REC and HTH domains [Hyphomicrobium facile]
MKILIVDDHGVVREGLRKLFVVHFEATVIETAGLEDALAVYAAERPDVVVLDLNLEGAGGLEVLRRIVAADSAARVVVFSMHHEPIYAVRALRGGARGYVSKSAPVEELISAIRKVRAGEQYIDRDLASRIAVSQISSDDPLQSLSTREVEILRMLGQGKSMTAISDNLGIAYKTVANICTQMKVKLGVDRTADLIRLAIETLKT